MSGILEIDPETRTLRRFPGTYSEYTATRRRELEHTWATYRDQQAEIARLEAVEAALAVFAGPFLVISHDRAFLDAIRINRAVNLDGGRIASDTRLDVPVGGMENR